MHTFYILILILYSLHRQCALRAVLRQQVVKVYIFLNFGKIKPEIFKKINDELDQCGR